MTPLKFSSLRSSMITDILILAVIGLTIVLVSAKVYQDLAFDERRDDMTELIGLRSVQLLEDLTTKLSEYGITIQGKEAFRNLITNKDSDGLVEYLNHQLKGFLVLLDNTMLVNLAVYDTDLNLLASTDSNKNVIDINEQCPTLINLAKTRTGPARIKIIDAFCNHHGHTYYNLLVPVNTLKPFAYLSIYTDPAPSLEPLEAGLGMPYKITHPNGTSHQSDSWPTDDYLDNHITSNYKLRNRDGETSLVISTTKNVAKFNTRIYKTTLTIIGIGMLLVTISIIVAFNRQKSILTPINALRQAAENARKGQYHKIEVSTYPELEMPLHSFNTMISEISTLIRKLEKENFERSETEIKLRQQQVELEKARDQAFTASRSKSAFLANMSHELRTPLNAIIGYCQLIKDDMEDAGPSPMNDDLDKINNAGHQLLKLISDILDLSKIEAGKIELDPVEIDINEYIHEITATAKPLMKNNNNSILIKISDNLGNMIVDVTRLRQALLNLLSNASKFTTNGTVTLSVDPIQEEDEDWLVFHVVDTGIGIAPEDVSKLFKEFSQIDSSTTRIYGGTGLGLVISQRFCDLMGGYITVQSEVDKGSQFSIHIPRYLNEQLLSNHPYDNDADEISRRA